MLTISDLVLCPIILEDPMGGRKGKKGVVSARMLNVCIVSRKFERYCYWIYIAGEKNARCVGRLALMRVCVLAKERIRLSVPSLVLHFG